MHVVSLLLAYQGQKIFHKKRMSTNKKDNRIVTSAVLADSLFSFATDASFVIPKK